MESSSYFLSLSSNFSVCYTKIPILSGKKQIKTLLKTYFVDNLGYFLMKNHWKILLRIFLVHLNALLSKNNILGENQGTRRLFLKCVISGKLLMDIFFDPWFKLQIYRKLQKFVFFLGEVLFICSPNIIKFSFEKIKFNAHFQNKCVTGT